MGPNGRPRQSPRSTTRSRRALALLIGTTCVSASALLAATAPSRAGATAIAPATGTCTATDTTTAAVGSSTSALVGVKPGDVIDVSCTGLTTDGTTPFTGSAAILEASGLAGVVSPASAEQSLVDLATLQFGTATSGTIASTAFTIPATFAATDTNAACPPTQAQVNAGIVECAIAVANIATSQGLNDIGLVYATTTAPNAPQLSITPTSGSAGSSVTVSDGAACPTPVAATSHCWFGAALTGASTAAGTMSAAFGTTAAGPTTSMALSPAVYCAASATAASCSGQPAGTLVGPHLSGTVATPASLGSGASTLEVDEINDTPFAGTGTLTKINPPVANVAATTTFTVSGGNAPPAITSADHSSFTEGSAGTFTVTATGTPTPTLSETGTPPTGVNFNSATGVLSGTPAAGTANTYPLVFSATNSAGTATQSFTLTVNAASTAVSPAITSANHTTFTAGSAGSFTVTATGTPTPTLSETGTLPTGVNFNSATGVMSGTAAAGTAGTYPLTFTAANSAGTTSQTFTLTVGAAPAITSASSATFTEGVGGVFGVTATGAPPPTLSESGRLPAGVTFTPTTGVLSGTPASGTSATYTLVITATNTVGSATQTFTLTVLSGVPASCLPYCHGTATTGLPATTTTTAGPSGGGSTTTPNGPNITVTPATGLSDGQRVTITGSKFPPNDSLVALECSPRAETMDPTTECNLAKANLTVKSDGSGNVVASLVVQAGVVGTDSAAVCPPASGSCFIAVSEPTATSSVRAIANISFGAGTPSGPAGGGGGGTTPGSGAAPGGGGAPTGSQVANVNVSTTTQGARVLGSTITRGSSSLPFTGTGKAMWAFALLAVGLIDLGYLAVSATWPDRRPRTPR